MAKAKDTDDPLKKRSAATKQAATEGAGEATPKRPAANKKRAAKKSETNESVATAGAADDVETTAAVAEGKETAERQASVYEGVTLPAASGKAGVLGGPKDRGGKPEDKLALPIGKHFTFERVRSLNPKSFYCAMRWDYKILNKSPEEAKRWWANKKLLVTNPANGNRVVVRAVDFGPHENTGLTISLSPGALEALGVEIGGDVEIEFADQKAPTGVIQE